MSGVGPIADALAELRRAVATVAKAYEHAGGEVDLDGPRWRELERQVDEAFASGDVARARASAAAWLRFALGEVRRAR